MEDSGSSPSGVTGEPVDTSELSFTATYSDGTTGSVVPSSYTPTSFGDTAGTQTVTFSFAGTDITVEVDYDVEAASPVLTGLTSGGDWSNTQYVAESVDPTGLTFTASYSDGTTDVVSPQSHIPTTWGDTVGTQTCTFSYTEDEVTVTCDVEANVQAASLMVTGISVSGTQANCNVQGSRFRPKGLVFTIVTNDGQEITTGPSSTADVDYAWTRADARADATCSITIDEITGDPSSIVTYNPSSSYFFGVGQVALTIRPNADCLEALGLDGYTIADSAYTTLNLDVINCYHLVGSIDDSLQIQGQAPDLTGATLYAYGSGGDKDPQTGLPTQDGTQINDPEFDPTVYSTTGTQTLSIRSSNTSTWGPVPMTTTVDVQPGTPVSTPTVTSLTISGTLTGTNTEGDYPDFSGITWTYGLDNGQTVVKTAQDYNDQFETQVFFTMDDSAGYDPNNEYKWASGSAGTQTVTFDCAGNVSSNWWTSNGYAIASPEPTATLQVTVQAAQ